MDNNQQRRRKCPQQESSDYIPIVVQNRIATVYAIESMDNVQPVQNNAFSASSSSDNESDMDDSS